MDRRQAMKRMAGAGTAVVLAGATTNAQTTATAEAKLPTTKGKLLEKNDLQAWLETTMQRVYPTTTPQEASTEHGKPLTLQSGRNYKLSFQACFRNTDRRSAQVKCSYKGLDGIQVRIRRVGFVPMQNLDTFTPLEELEGIGKIPGLCPDPLFPETTAHIGPMGTGVFWISLYVPEGVQPGLHKGEIEIALDNRFGYMGMDNPEKFTLSLPFEVNVKAAALKPRQNFPVTRWISADSIWEYYKLKPFSEEAWKLIEAYIKNMIEHGVDAIYTPIFNIRDEVLKTPAQLLRVKQTSPDVYEFDFVDIRRWIRLAMDNGANYVEFSHFFSPAPASAQFSQRIYERDAEKLGDQLWKDRVEATSATYRKFLDQFIPAFKKVLEEEGVLDKSFFHCADEPDGDVAIENYRKARGVLKEVAPWMKVMDAMSEPHFATNRLSDMPVPSIVTAHKFVAANCPAWAYYCCGPRDGYLQNLLDTPLYKIRMAGFLFFQLKAMGFLHWGYNYWFYFCSDRIDDPFKDASNGYWPGMPYGDTFVVYPGADGPLDSIRWEILAEGMQDYALLQTAGAKPDEALLREIKDYNVFPKSPEWINKAVTDLLGRASG